MKRIVSLVFILELAAIQPAPGAAKDLNADHKADAAVLFEVERADNTQLLLIPAILKSWSVVFRRRSQPGRTRLQHSDCRARNADSIIKVSVKAFDKETRSEPPQPWISMRFKLHNGNQLIKLK